MKLFHWQHTKCNGLYGAGDIVVMAADLEQAKTIALEQARSAQLGYSDMDELAKQSWDPEDAREEIEKKLHELKLDLHEDPVIYDSAHALFISGSE